MGVEPKTNPGIKLLFRLAEHQLRQARRSGGHITDAEADIIWNSPPFTAAKAQLNLGDNEIGVVRRLYNHLVARANYDGPDFPHYPAVAEAYANHNMHAQSAIFDQKRDALKDGHISDSERASLAKAYQSQLGEAMPPSVRRALVEHQLDLMDFENMKMSFQQSELCVYGPGPVRAQLAATIERIRRH